MSDSSCLFCRIAAEDIPADIVQATPDVVAFRDIHPQAPTHILLVPRRHIASTNELETGETAAPWVLSDAAC